MRTPRPVRAAPASPAAPELRGRLSGGRCSVAPSPIGLLACAVVAAACASPSTERAVPRLPLESVERSIERDPNPDPADLPPAPDAVSEPLGLAHWLLLRAEARVATGHRSGARADLDLARAAVPDPGDPAARRLAHRVERLTGDIAFAEGRFARAESAWRSALDLALTSRERDLVAFRLALLEEARGGSGAHLRSRLTRSDRSEYAALAGWFGETLRPPEPTRSMSSTRPRAAATTEPRAPTILPRRAWGAAPLRANKDPMTPIFRITVHHEGVSFDRSDYASSARRIRGIQRYHQEERHWADIGYHFLIDRAGRVWEGRPLAWQGAHAGNFALNRGNIGVCLLGDYRSQRVTPGQRRALFDLLDSLRRRYGIPAGAVYTHAEIRPSPSLCPGAHLDALVHEYRRARGAGALAAAPKG